MARWNEILAEFHSLQDPIVAAQLLAFDYSSEAAVSELAALNGIQPGWQTNALAHTATSAWLTYSYGYSTAKAVGNAKEWDTADRDIARGDVWDLYKDMWNNEIGRQIGLYAAANTWLQRN